MLSPWCPFLEKPPLQREACLSGIAQHAANQWPSVAHTFYTQRRRKPQEWTPSWLLAPCAGPPWELLSSHTSGSRSPGQGRCDVTPSSQLLQPFLKPSVSPAAVQAEVPEDQCPLTRAAGIRPGRRESAAQHMSLLSASWPGRLHVPSRGRVIGIRARVFPEK